MSARHVSRAALSTTVLALVASCRAAALPRVIPTTTSPTATSPTGATPATAAEQRPGISSLTTQPTSIRIKVGDSAQVLASAARPVGAPAGRISFSSSTSDIATVNNNGLLVARAAGTATVLVTVQSPAGSGFRAAILTAAVAVTVSAR